MGQAEQAFEPEEIRFRYSLSHRKPFLHRTVPVREESLDTEEV